MTGNGPDIRTDVVDVYVFRRGAGRRGGRSEIWFLQMLRSGPPLDGTWHPVMGHVEKGETAIACAAREMREELGLRARTADLLGFWALEQVHPFYIAAIDTIVMSPRFAAEMAPTWTPRLNAEHAEWRWVRAKDIDASFMWPGQRAACREVQGLLSAGRTMAADHLRVDPFPITVSAKRKTGRAERPARR